MDPKLPRERSRWGAWSWVLLSLLALIVILPLAKSAFPLMSIWRSSRSEKLPSPGDAPNPFQVLTNQLAVLDHFSDNELDQIVSRNFGTGGQTTTNAAEFDVDTAVFDSISRTSVTRNGTSYYEYRVVLVDRSGNQTTNIESFLKPNLEYERSLATMELINRSPQLKRIYRAMGAGLAEKTVPATNQSADSSSNRPPLGLEPNATR